MVVCVCLVCGWCGVVETDQREVLRVREEDRGVRGAKKKWVLESSSNV